MRLFELFEDDAPNLMGNNVKADGKGGDENDGGDLIHRLREDVIDVLMPLAAHGVPFVTIQQVMDKLKERRSGIEIDRALVMKLLDPQEVKLVTKIEGDRVYFKLPDPSERAVDDQQKQRDVNKVAKAAQTQAKKNVSASGPLG